MDEEEKVAAALSLLKQAGHTVERQLGGEDGKMTFSIDNRMVVSWEEMQEITDSINPVEELEDFYRKRQIEKAGA